MECNNLNKNKVLVGVSGGVDSSVCVDLLKKQGLEVEGVVIRFSDAHDNAVKDAQKVCDHLGITLHVADACVEFEKNVVHPFCQSYVDGLTPNPCVICNPQVKFATLKKTADALGIFYIATGHYAQVEKQNDIYHVKKAISLSKDQSYMLYRLPQEILSRLILPLGGFEKPIIREKAKDAGLFTADKPDSQEICFIPSGDHAGFIEEKGFKSKSGWFISPEGKKIKKHLGVHHYTVGQRKGLNVALGKPAFVKEITGDGNILLGYSGDEYFNGVTLITPVYTECKPFEKDSEYTVKIRSASKGDNCKVISACENEIVIEFLRPVRAAAKGQSVVFYKDDLVMGGGFISSANPYKNQ